MKNERKSDTFYPGIYPTNETADACKHCEVICSTVVMSPAHNSAQNIFSIFFTDERTSTVSLVIELTRMSPPRFLKPSSSTEKTLGENSINGVNLEVYHKFHANFASTPSLFLIYLSYDGHFNFMEIRWKVLYQNDNFLICNLKGDLLIQ